VFPVQEYGSQSMAAPLKRVLMRRASSAMRRADPAEWHYGPKFDPTRAAAEHDGLVGLVAKSGAAIEFLPDDDDGLADSVFTHDPSLMTDHGALILSMGKALRGPEPALHEAAYRRLGIPILGRVEAPGTVEGGDCVWIDRTTLAIGRGGGPTRRAFSRSRTCLGRKESGSTASICRSGRARRRACT
jgi:N-dimethylarginine dimethylaminohydrolase